MMQTIAAELNACDQILKTEVVRPGAARSSANLPKGTDGNLKAGDGAKMAASVETDDAMRGRHSTVHFKYGKQEGDIDLKIAPVIEEMWRAGLYTMMSCQDNPPGWVWIFLPASQLEELLTIIGDEDPELCRRMLPSTIPSEGEWRYDLRIQDFPVRDAAARRRIGSCHFMVLMSVRFPHRDIPVVLRRLKEFNRGQRPSPVHGRRTASEPTAPHGTHRKPQRRRPNK